MPNPSFTPRRIDLTIAALIGTTLLLAWPRHAHGQSVASARIATPPAAPETTTVTPAAPAAAPAPTPSPALPVPIVFSGEIRTRSEWDRPGGAVAADAFTYLRTRFGARIDAAPGARIVLQLQDSRVLGAEGNTTTTAPDVFDLHQGYVELSAPWRGIGLGVRAGRQEIALANERLVGPVGWSNTGRSFDGARLMLAPANAKPGAEPWTATLFGATVEERGRRFGATPATDKAPDHAVAGLFVTRALPGRGALEATALYDGGARYRAYDRSNRATFDARLRAPRLLGAVSAELEGAYQLGRQRWVPADTALDPSGQRVRAWLVGARVGTPTSAPARRASAALGVDVLSGDATPTDGRYGAFSTMFATNHPFYGLMDLFTDPAARTKDRGLVDALATSSVALDPAVTLRADLHHFSLAAGDTRPLGWEGDLILPVRVSGAAAVELGYTLFRAERAAPLAGLGASGTTRHWAYLQLRAGF